MKIYEASPTETPETLPPPPQPQQGVPRRVCSAIGLIAIIAIASILVAVFFVPTGEAITIPLGMNCSEGEEMTYSLTIKISMSALRTPPTITSTAKIRMKILSFDGTNYTIRYTVETHAPTRVDFSYTIKMNKTGHILEFTELPWLSSDVQQIYRSLIGIPGYGYYFTQEQVEAGKRYQSPLNISLSGFSIRRTINYGVSEVASKMFPYIGLRDVFRMDVWANDMQATVTSSGMTVSMAINLNGYMYMEYETCLPIAVNVQETAIASYMGQTMSANLNMQMLLVEHNKP